MYMHEHKQLGISVNKKFLCFGLGRHPLTLNFYLQNKKKKED